MKVLIAEDDRFIRQGLQDLLEAEGYTCVLAEDGGQALAVFHREQPQVVLLDIMMPVANGYSVCREIRKTDDATPVIFITAKSEEIDQALGLELGADDYIKKPFGSREVVARIRAVTRRHLRIADDGKQPGSAPGSSFILADLTVFPDELRARRNGAVIELSPRDIKILTLLYQQKGKVVDRDSLFNRCWGRHYLANSRTLDQHISKLRKAIEKDPREPEIIHTVHGFGYRYSG